LNLEAQEPVTAVDEAVDLPEDVYARIVQQVREICEQVAQVDAEEVPREAAALPHWSSTNPENPSQDSANQDSVTPPLAPQSLAETGINAGQLAELTLKTLYLSGMATGYEISRQLRLPFSVVAETLQALKADRCLDVTSGEVVGPLSYRFLLTEQGRQRSRDAFAVSRYVGPAPVSLEHYTRQCQLQTVARARLNLDQLQQACQNLVLDADLLRRLGPAICSGQSIFLYGTPGNGKTAIAKVLGALLNQNGGSIYVPYALTVENQIISIFDPTLHRPVPARHASVTESDESRLLSDLQAPVLDERWREVRRPVVLSGGELTLDMLDLRYHAGSGYYTAPLQLKANGGVFLIDDFGRQIVPPAQLLNRWILPLEERIDYLTLSTGKKFAVPFEQLTVFSTNLNPEQLVDAAFLRRIRHKIEVPAPTEAQFRQIFRRMCDLHAIKYDDWIVTRLLTTQYDSQNPPKASDPRDLLDVIESICRFRGEKPHLSEKIVFEAFQECLGGPRLQG